MQFVLTPFKESLSPVDTALCDIATMWHVWGRKSHIWKQQSLISNAGATHVIIWGFWEPNEVDWFICLPELGVKMLPSFTAALGVYRRHLARAVFWLHRGKMGILHVMQRKPCWQPSYCLSFAQFEDCQANCSVDAVCFFGFFWQMFFFLWRTLGSMNVLFFMYSSFDIRGLWLCWRCQLVPEKLWNNDKDAATSWHQPARTWLSPVQFVPQQELYSLNRCLRCICIKYIGSVSKTNLHFICLSRCCGVFCVNRSL